MTSAEERARRIRVFLLDVDGVLTDNGVWFQDDGRSAKRFDIRDGAVIKLAQRSGALVGFLSGHRSGATEARAKDLGVDFCFTGVPKKDVLFDEQCAARGWNPEEVFYMGDDWIDMPVLEKAGFAATVPHAPDEVKSLCHYVTTAPAGFGAVREAVAFVLRAQGRLDGLIRDAFRR